MTTTPVEVAEWLCSPVGRACVDRVTDRLDAGEDPLTVGTHLRRQGLAPPRATGAVAAASARRRARGRWPDADRLLLTPDGLEQASDPEVAAWRARRFAARDTWDLCAGLGGDSLALAAAGARVTALDLDPARLRLLAHNAAVRGLSVTVREEDALAAVVPAGAWVHADPSRRTAGGRRLRRLADHRPPVPDLLARHAGAEGTGVVLSPAVDLEDPDLPADAELEFVEDHAGLRESVAWRGEARAPGVAVSATLLPDGHHRQRRAAPASLPVGTAGSHLVEVAPAAVRARLHTQIGAEIGARRLAERRALLTCDGPPPPSPWYRARAVLAVLPARARAVRRWLAGREPVPVEIAVHGLEADPARWWRALGRPPRGPQGYRVELVRTDEGARALITDARRERVGTLSSS